MKWALQHFRSLRKMETVSSWFLLLSVSYAVVRLTFLGLNDSADTIVVLTAIGGLVLGLALHCKLRALIGPAIAIAIAFFEVTNIEPLINSIGALLFLEISILLPPVIGAFFMKKVFPGEYIERPIHLFLIFAITLIAYLIISIPLYYYFYSSEDIWFQRMILDCSASSVNLMIFGPFFAYLVTGHETHMPANKWGYFIFTILLLVVSGFVTVYPWEIKQIQLFGMLSSLPVIMFIAHRFPLLWVIVSLIAHIVSLIFFTGLDMGPFAMESNQFVRAIAFQTYTAFIIVSVLILALYRRNQETATEALTAMNEHLEDLVEKRTESLEEVNENLKKENEVRKQLEAVLQRQALKDSITDLPGRDGLRIEYVDWMDPEQTKETMLLVVVGIDGFKSVNDALGHTTGDEILRRTASRLSTIIGDKGVIARWAGDEFVILCDETNGPGIENILNEVKEPFSIVGDTIHLTATAGVTYPKEHSFELEESIRCAALAMQRAKKQEKGTYLFYDTVMEETARHHIQMLAALKDALEMHDFEVYYQPILSNNGKKLYGMEALIRWKDRKSGNLIPPGSFIPFAERTGLIIPIGLWMMSTVIDQVVQWQNQGFDFGMISINASARQLEQIDFADHFLELLGNAGLSPSCFQIEITESVLLDSQDIASKNIARLTASGISMALDDFGTGYSSLGYLEKFPVQSVKIDRSFVQSLRSGMNASAVIQAIGFIAKQLELKVIVEGIENQVELEQVSNLIFADGWQGYLFSKPLSANDMSSFISRSQQSVALHD